MKRYPQFLLVVTAFTNILSAQVITETFGRGLNQFSIDFVNIGNPGNAADMGNYSGTSTPYQAGSVGYVFNIGKYEVSRNMVERANADGGLGISLYDMTNYGGNGVNRPATGVSWNEAARFVNWLNASKGFQVAYKFTTSGANDNIALWGDGEYIGNNKFRHKDAHYFLPSLDEWYKAAYGSPQGLWYDYPTGSDTTPVAVNGGLLYGSSVYGQSGPSDITEAGGLSPYGTMGQGGNVVEWNETAFDGISDNPNEKRIVRGGEWRYNVSAYLLASNPGDYWPDDPANEPTGFRVAMVPEPSSLSLLLIGVAGVASRRLLKRRG